MASIPYEMYADNGNLWGVCNNKNISIILDNPKKLIKKIKLEYYIRTLHSIDNNYYICINSKHENKSYYYHIKNDNFEYLFSCNHLVYADKNTMVISMYMFQKIQQLLYVYN